MDYSPLPAAAPTLKPMDSRSIQEGSGQGNCKKMLKKNLSFGSCITIEADLANCAALSVHLLNLLAASSPLTSSHSFMVFSFPTTSVPLTCVISKVGHFFLFERLRWKRGQ